VKELAIFKSEIEKQLQPPAPIAKPYVSLRKKLQTTTKQNIPPLPNSPFNPLPLMSIPCQGIDDEESVMLVCAFFNLLLRAIGVKRTYEADQVNVPKNHTDLDLHRSAGSTRWPNFLDTKTSLLTIIPTNRPSLTCPPKNRNELYIPSNPIISSHTPPPTRSKSIFQQY
jgi:hypothetical protein